MESLASLEARLGQSGAATWPMAWLEQNLAPLRHGTPLTLVEFAPAPLSREQVWCAAFPAARVVAVRPGWPVEAPPADLADRLRRRGGAQNDDGLLRRILAEDRPSLVLDAGAAPRWQQVAALAALYPALPPGGLYLWAASPEPGDAAPEAMLRRCLGATAAALATLVARLSETVAAGPGLLLLRRNDLRIAEAFETRPLAETADRLREVETGGAYARLPAELLDCPPALLRRFAAEAAPPGRLVPAFPGQVGLLQEAVVRGRGVVVTRRGALVEESLINARPDAMAAGLLKLEAGRRYLDPAGPRAAPRRLAGAPRILLKQAWDDNYGHWLIESLPRLDLVARAGWLTPEARCLVQAEVGPMRQVYLDSLGFFGLDAERVEFTTGAPVAVETLVYPAPITRQPWAKAPSIIALLERFPEAAARRLGAAAPAAPRRLFVARESGRGRRLLNATEIAAELCRRGFVTVVPERLGFWEQVAMFARAEIVVGVLGAGMANLAFAPRGLTCVALTSEAMGDDFFYDLLCHKGGRYVSIHGPARDPSQGMHADFTIDPARLAPFLP